MLHQQTPEAMGRMIGHYDPVARASESDPRVDLKELVGILKRRRVSILVTAAIPVLIALVYGFLATPLYTASTQILIDPRDRRIVSNDVNPDQTSSDGGLAIVESQQQVIASDSVLRRVIAKQKLAHDPEFAIDRGVAATLERGLAAVGIVAQPQSEDPELNALRLLRKRVTVKRAGKAFVVDVAVTTDDPAKSVRVANAVAANYLQDWADSNAAASRRAADELAGQLTSLRKKVQDAEDRVVAYKKAHGMIASTGVLVSDQQLNALTAQLSQQQLQTAAAQSRVAQIEAARRLGARCRGDARGGAVGDHHAVAHAICGGGAAAERSFGDPRTQAPEDHRPQCATCRHQEADQ